MSLQELQKYTSISKYARWLKDKQRREIWDETVERYTGMLCEKYPHRGAEIRRVSGSILARDVMPSMRGLQFGGRPVFQHNARLYNCSTTYLDRLRALPEAFYMLLCGSGVGMSVQDTHLRHLPGFSKKRLAGVKLPRKKFAPPDSIEGWADCHMALLSAWHVTPIKGFEDYHDCEIVWDFTNIRPAGAELSFGIGRAPGPAILRRSLHKCADLLQRAVASGLEKLNDVYASDYLMHEADAVLSGGVRRSATALIFDVESLGMRNWKVGNWFDANPQRARANISPLLLRDETSFETFLELFESTRQFGEPGFYWSGSRDFIPNPCFEIGMVCSYAFDRADGRLPSLLKDYDGPLLAAGDDVRLSGWQGCNLSTLNGKTLAGETKQERARSFLSRCEDASLLGTWQAGFDSFPYLGRVSELIFQGEALIGVSVAGMMHHPDVLLDPEVLEAGASLVIETNRREAKRIGINQAARTTCVKPDGNSAASLGCFSGCHPGKFRKGFRIVQANKIEPVYEYFKQINPAACEPSVWSTTDDCIRFCVEFDGLLESDTTAVEFLKNVQLIQTHWVGAGTVHELCVRPGVSHNVSNTVRVRPHEWHDVARQIYDNRAYYSGVSLLAWSGDRDYAQAPFTSVYSPQQQEAYYGPAVRSEYVEKLLGGSCIFANLWDACALALGQWDLSRRRPTIGQFAWSTSLKIFADLRFGGDVHRATHVLKDVSNWRLYCRLKDAYTSVDYACMVETENNVNLQQEISCAGGACES